MPLRLGKIISGGQTGVDRAALDVALALGIPCGGWCPRRRLAEDSRIPDQYPLTETATEDYGVRTELNVLFSDATLLLTLGEVTGGTHFTRMCARHHHKPCLEVPLDAPLLPGAFQEWITNYEIRVLNVAGPRESHRPGQVYRLARQQLEQLLKEVRE